MKRPFNKLKEIFNGLSHVRTLELDKRANTSLLVTLDRFKTILATVRPSKSGPEMATSSVTQEVWLPTATTFSPRVRESSAQLVLSPKSPPSSDFSMSAHPYPSLLRRPAVSQVRERNQFLTYKSRATLKNVTL